jgi:type IV pilus assembly protein PilC
MKNFSVRVQNQDNSFDIISVKAETAQDAMEKVSLQGKIPLEAFEETETKSGFLSSFGSVPASELYHFTRLFATLTRAGIPLLEALEMLISRVNNSKLQNSLTDITNGIKSGRSIKESFQKQKGVFDQTYLQLLEVGEESGNLPQVLDRLTILLKKRIELKRMIVRALTYPLLVLVLSTVVVVAILVYIVPRFKDIYSRFGGDLPFITKFTLKCSDILISYFPAVIGSVIAASILFMVLKRTKPGKRLFDLIVLKTPMFGSMFHTYDIAGFAKSFSMLVNSGITVTGALDLIKEAVDRVQISEALDRANQSVKEGKGISDSFDNELPWLPELLNRMVAVGERSGNLPEMLDHVAEFYEEEFNNKVETLASLIEPMLIVFLGVVIGGIVISLYLPIFGMAKLISQR